ncbi:gas vesicle protein GvpJ [Actinopolymorpha sp. B9G3]|uniref:gas vesicle protein GvpJ n=1 Tax=Actinopolymorpha sp. B9G3 TaxID=3158970 RepID=UPI0032D95060
MSDRRLALDDGSLVDVLDRLLDAGAYLDGTVLLTLAGVDLVRLDLRLLLASVNTLRPDSSAQQSRHLAAGQRREAVPREAEVRASDEVLDSNAPFREMPASVGPTSGRPVPEGTVPERTVPERTVPERTVPERTVPERTVPERTVPAMNGEETASLIRTANDLTGGDSSGNRAEGDDNRQAGIAGLVVVLVDIVRQLLERQALRRMDAGTLTEAEVERLGRSLMALEQQTAELTDFVGRQRRHPPPIGSARDLDLGMPLTDSGRRAHP